MAEFALLLNEESGGAVVARIAQIYGHFFFDEIQDVSARDFEFLQLLLESPVTMTLSGDPRQGTYSTTASRTNRGLTKSNVIKWLAQMEKLDLLSLEERNHSWRCGQAICDFADALYPEFADTRSLNVSATGHDGVFLLRKDQIPQYVATYSPQLLVWDRRSEHHGLPRRNMGEVKGMTFPRVLIQPTGPIAKYLSDGSVLVEGARAKFYVAATRARHSVAIVLDDPGASAIRYWVPD
ncbi:hypothetical protein [Cryobacterium glucosi]|uniref:hypothetical protein n=1 Tax=Cryobacterium TaxID=69578 RepID=UPI00141AFD9B